MVGESPPSPVFIQVPLANPNPSDNAVMAWSPNDPKLIADIPMRPFNLNGYFVFGPIITE